MISVFASNTGLGNYAFMTDVINETQSFLGTDLYCN
jgi:hypothetical protein